MACRLCLELRWDERKGWGRVAAQSGLICCEDPRVTMSRPGVVIREGMIHMAPG